MTDLSASAAANLMHSLANLPNSLFTIAAIGVLVIVHELGHFLVARAFKMRVLRFSLGIGPVLWSKKPEGSATTYQIALLPLLAYVQIAGMNPMEEIDEQDRGSYANASWAGRVLTIFAGPLANYLLAVVLFFFLLVFIGRAGVDGLKVGEVLPKSPAAAASILVHDEVQAIGGKAVHDWREMRDAIQSHKGQSTTIELRRNGEVLTLNVTPSADKGLIGVGARWVYRPVSVGEALKSAVVEPPQMAVSLVDGLVRVLTGREKAELRGVVGIVEDLSHQLKEKGFADFISSIVVLSIYVCVFNLMPFPALDGGRLAFLAYEAIARRRPDAKVEARVHMIGLIALLAIAMPLLILESYHAIFG